MVTAAMKLEDNCFLAAIMTVMTHLDSMLKSKDISLLTKVHIVNALVCVVVMYGCMNWAIRRQNTKQCFQTVVLEKILESPLESREINPVNLKGNLL